MCNFLCCIFVCLVCSSVPVIWYSGDLVLCASVQYQVILVINSNEGQNISRKLSPISLLCYLSKVLERLIFDKVFGFAAESIVYYNQFGFMKNAGRSTVT